MKYQDNKGRIVKVANIEGNIATLNNGERVATERLNDSRYYTPVGGSSPSTTTTVNESHNNVGRTTGLTPDEIRYKQLLSSQNKSVSIGDVDDTYLQDAPRLIPTQQSQVKMSGSVVESHRQNLKSIGKDPDDGNVPVTSPYRPEDRPRTNTQATQTSTNVSMSQEEELLRKYNYNPEDVKRTDPKLEELAYGKDVKREERINNSENYPQSLPQEEEEEIEEENPVHQMFDKAKKVHSLKVTLKLDEKIPDKDVIKMMEENFEESAIEYYAKDIYKKLMEDPSVIEDQVKDAIEKYLRSRKRTSKKS